MARFITEEEKNSYKVFDLVLFFFLFCLCLLDGALLVEDGGLFVINVAAGFLPTAAVENSPVHHRPGYLMRSYPPLLRL